MGGKRTKNPNRKLPYGGWAQDYPARRLCDFAVNSFVQKFALDNVNERPERKISFGLHSTTYRNNQIAEVRELVKQRLAKISASGLSGIYRPRVDKTFEQRRRPCACPVCGSGTTCIAAKTLNRRYLGIEINSEQVAVENERLSNNGENQ